MMQTHRPVCPAWDPRWRQGKEAPIMELLEDTLDRLARSGEAAFAMDGGGRITHWNKACEKLLGKPARHVLGKRCQDVMCGRDGNGNLYCHTACPVAHQARALAKNDPVHPFELDVAAGDGSRRRLSVSLFAIPSYHPALTAVVHTLRPAAENSGVPERAGDAPEPGDTRVSSFNGAAAALTGREREVLDCLARGLSTPAIAQELSVARVTVRNHIQGLLQKLGVHSKLEAVVEAQRAGIVQRVGVA
jgi:DNA-binding CsgD family transcriptional regulator